jgi:hypothetical protein
VEPLFIAGYCVLFVIVKRMAFSENGVIVRLSTTLMQTVTVFKIFIVVAHRVGCKLTVSHLISVGFLMGSQVATLGESLIAVPELANVWLLPCVRPVVSPEVEIKRKLLSSNISSERLFSL